MGLAINHLSERAELSAQLTSGLSNFDDASSFLCFLYHMVCASFLKQKCVCVCVCVCEFSVLASSPGLTMPVAASVSIGLHNSLPLSSLQHRPPTALRVLSVLDVRGPDPFVLGCRRPREFC